MKALLQCTSGAVYLIVAACGREDVGTPVTPDAAVSSDASAASAVMQLLPADHDVEGRSLEQWATEYMRWHYSWTSDDCLSAETDPDGSHCSLGQDPDSPVFFIASSSYSTQRNAVVRRNLCNVPQGKALLVPISFVSDDDAASDHKRPAEEIEESARAIQDSMRELLLIADDENIADLSSYSIGPTSFEFSVPGEPNWYTCNGYPGIANKTVHPSYLVGYFALFDAPSKGSHVVEFASVQSYFNSDFFFHVENRFLVE